MPSYISKITLPSGTTYDIKDAQAWTDIADIREKLANKTAFHVVTNEADTPYGVTWVNNQGVTITGELQASAVQNKSWIYLVPKSTSNTLTNPEQTYNDGSITLRKYWTDTEMPTTDPVTIFECSRVWYSDGWKADGTVVYSNITCNAQNTTSASTVGISDGTLSIQYQIDDPTFTVGMAGIYSEYIVINQGTDSSPAYKWEKLGDTSIDLSDLGELAFKDEATGSILIPTSASVSGIPNTYTFTGTPYSGNTGAASASDIGTVTPGSAASFTQGTFTQGTLPSVDTTKFSGGSYTRGTFNQGTLPSVTDNTTQITVSSEVLDLSKVLTGPFSQGTLPTHAADSFTPASISTGFFNAGTLPTHAADSFTANTPTSVTLKQHSHTISFTPGGSVTTNTTTSKTVTLNTTLTPITVS